MSEWRDIDSAPKDGTEFVVKGGFFNCAYTQIDGFPVESPQKVAYKEQSNPDVDPPFRVVGECYGIEGPTHWMPLPKPPELPK